MNIFGLILNSLLTLSASSPSMQNYSLLGNIKPHQTITTRSIELQKGNTTIEVIADNDANVLVCKFVDADGHTLSEQKTSHCLINARQPTDNVHFNITLTNTQDKDVGYEVLMHDTK